MSVSRYEFGAFLLDPSEHRLLREDVPIPLSPKVFELLVTLVASHGRLIPRDMLMKTLWPDSFVEETNLTVNISLLRKTLGNSPSGQPWIATIPKRGYRFDGPVLELTSPAIDAPPAGPASVSPPVASPDSFPSESIQSQAAAAEPAKPALTHESAPIRFPYAWAALVVLVAAGLLWAGVRFFTARVAAKTVAVRTIAVLPFASPGAAGENQYLGVGLTDAVITRLGRLSQIVVRPIGAVRSLGDAPDPIEAGKKLNVQAVLDGTVHRIGDHIQVAVRLRRVSDGNLLWSESFDEHTSSDFEIEDAISQRLASALTLRLSPEEKRQLARPDTPNAQAHELYTQGRFFWNKRSVESVAKSIELFRQATSLDPNYAEAWAGLADALILSGSYGNSFLAPSDAMPKAKEAAQKALALDDSSAEAHTSLAYIHFVWDWDYASAESEFKRAIAANPGYVNAHHWYSHQLIAQGRVGESHEESELALGLDPTDVVINEHMAWHHMMTREYDRSLPQARKAVELDPSFVQAHRVLALDLLYTGQEQEACAEFAKGVELSHDDPVARAYLARCYAVTHREADARKMLAGLEQAAAERYISAAEIAAGYAALNNPDAALKWLDKACDERSGSLVYLNADRVWDPLRSNPRFQANLRRVNLPVQADESAPRSNPE